MSKIRLISNKEEEVICYLNDHWVAISKAFLALILVIIFSIPLINFINWINSIAPQVAIILKLTTYGLALIFTHWFFLSIMNWLVSDWYITNQKIISFDNKPFVKSDTTFIKISEIHEVEKKKRGLLRNLLDYGDVIINVAAVPNPIKLKNLPCPSRFVNLIEEIRSKSNNREINVNALAKRYGGKLKFI